MQELLVRLGDWIKRRYFPVQYDSGEHAAEAYYASVYLEHIRRALASIGSGPLRIVCGGCGTGRIAIPLAEDGHEVTGVDHYRDSLRVAARNAKRAGVDVQLIDARMLPAVASLPAQAYDAVLGIESMYMHRDLPGLISGLSGLLRPGGLFFGTHRTRFYYVLYCLANDRFEDALAVMSGSSGRLQKGPVRFFYNWQTTEEVEDLYRQANLKILERHPIGPYSGFGYDPLTGICDPGTLNDKQLEDLRKIEMAADPETTMAARYVLVTARKERAVPG